MAKKSVLDAPPPEIEDNVNEEGFGTVLEHQKKEARESEAMEKATAKNPTALDDVYFILQEQPNDRFKDPLPVIINGSKISIHRGEETSAPRTFVAGAENHYLPTQFSGRHPKTGAKLKRKIKGKLYETVTLVPNPHTGMINPIDIARQKALRAKIVKDKADALNYAIRNQ